MKETKTISKISDPKFINSFIPCGILITKADEHFTILEANQTYFDIIGFTREEVRDLYNNHGMDMILPQDRIALMEHFHAELQNDPEKSMEFVCNIVAKESAFKTVQLKGKLLVDEEGKLRLYIVLTDISSYVKTMEELKSERDFNTLIASVTDNVFFDYNIRTKIMQFSKKFADRLQIPEQIEEFGSSKEGKAIFADYVKIFDIQECSQAPKTKIENEIHIQLADGELVWYMYSCETVCDVIQNGCHIVGKMTDITKRKVEIEALKVKAEMDQLTGIYNKTATERYIHEYLKITSYQDESALFIIDLDNFKQLNDTFGHLYGDQVLTEIGEILRRTFRAGDIVGRLGGDEFFVFIKNYGNHSILKEKAESLCNELAQRIEENGLVVDLSASIGISLFPNHGTDFQTLYQKADEALYLVKARGKKGFSIYEEHRA